MTKRSTTRKIRDGERAQALFGATQSLVEKLIAEDPRLRTACKKSQYIANGSNGIGEDTLQIYRQRLGEG